jgi:probable phosphoglycerate mutase
MTTHTAGSLKRRRLYVMRHGDVSYFDDTGKPNVPTTVPLNDAGREQAQAAAQALATIPFDRVLASDLPRSIETATIVAAGRCPVETEPALREIHPGRLTDIPQDGVEEAFLNAFTGNLGRADQFLGGETYGALEDRVNACLDTIQADHRWKQLLIVAHGGVNRVILARALGLGLASFGDFEQDPACLNIFDVSDTGRWIVRLVNHTPYNPAKEGIELTTMEQLYLQYRARKAT